MYGIEHTQGLYHHNGQVGPKIHPGDNYLPSFGQSNPPPNVWNACNLLILDINTSYQANLVKAFVRLHGRPWTAPEDNKESPVNKEISNPTSGGSKKKPLNHVDRWMQDQARRIPRYSYDAPRAAAEPVPLDEARLMDILNARTNLPQLPENESFEAVLERNTTHHPYSATHDQQAGHRHGTIRVHTAQIHHAPVHLPGIGELIDQGLVPTPSVTGRLHVVNPDVVEEETVDRQQSIRFADEMDGDANDVRRS